jgi:hypothetical protein
LYNNNANSFWKELKLLLLCAAIGYVGDSALMYVDIFEFGDSNPAHVAPAWLGMIWLAFASTINSSLSYLARLSVGAQAILGALFGPAVYFFSKKYTDIIFVEPQLKSYLLLMIYWAIIMPLFFYIRLFFFKKNST